MPSRLRITLALLGILGGIGVPGLQVLRAEAAPCAPQVCIPLPTLPAPQPSPPAAFGTPAPRPFATATPTPSAQPSPGATPVPGPGGTVVPGQDVGVTAVSQAAENSASGLAKQLNNQLVAPNLGGDWFRPLYNRMTTIALYVLLFCLILAAVQYIVNRRLGLVVGSWFGWAPGSIAITALGITLTNVLLAITDALSAYVIAGIDIPSFLLHLAAVLALAGAGSILTGQLVLVAGFLSGLLILALVGIIAELLMRQVVMYACLGWLPLVAASSVWTPARQWLYRLAKLQFVVIFAKFAILFMLALGALAFSSDPRAVGSLGDSNLVAFVLGLIILGLAVASPYVLLRLLPHDFEHAAAAVSQRGRRVAWKASRRFGRNLGQRFLERKMASKGLPVATKGGYAVVPFSLVLKGGQVIATRGGRVTNAGKAKGPRRKPKATPNSQP